MYQGCLAVELGNRRIRFEREFEIPLVYDGVTLDTGYRLNFLVEDQVVVEVKSVIKIGEHLRRGAAQGFAVTSDLHPSPRKR